MVIIIDKEEYVEFFVVYTYDGKFNAEITIKTETELPDYIKCKIYFRNTHSNKLLEKICVQKDTEDECRDTVHKYCEDIAKEIRKHRKIEVEFKKEETFKIKL